MVKKHIQGDLLQLFKISTFSSFQGFVYFYQFYFLFFVQAGGFMCCTITSTLLGGVIIICYSISIAQHYYWYYYDAEMAITAITLILGIVEFAIGIWAAVLCCYITSCECYVSVTFWFLCSYS